MHTSTGKLALVLFVPLLAVALALLPATTVWASPFFHGDETGPGGPSLATWKAILTTVLLALALLQFLGQAVVRGWIRIKIDKKMLAPLHRLGGIASLLLTLLILGLCLYVMFGPEGGGLMMLSAPTAWMHALFGSLLALVLISKVIISNFLRRSLRLNTPLGIAAGVLTLAVWVTSAMPHLFGINL